MPCVVPGDMTKCTEKCRCPGGPCANIAFECANPCLPGQLYNKYTCECADGADCGICLEVGDLWPTRPVEQPKWLSYDIFAYNSDASGTQPQIEWLLTENVSGPGQYSWNPTPNQFIPTLGKWSKTNNPFAGGSPISATFFAQEQADDFIENYFVWPPGACLEDYVCDEVIPSFDSNQIQLLQEPAPYFFGPNVYGDITCCRCGDIVRRITGESCSGDNVCPDGTECFSGNCYPYIPQCD